MWLCYLTTHCVAKIISLVFLEHSSRFKAKDQLPYCPRSILSFLTLSTPRPGFDYRPVPMVFVMDTTEVDRFFPPEYFTSSLSVELHRATAPIGDSSEQISYCCMFCNRTVLGTGKRIYYTARGPCYGSDGQSAVVPWIRQSAVVPWIGRSVGGCDMAQEVSRRLCHGSGGQSALVPWIGRSVGGCAMAQAVSWRLCHGPGSQSAAVPWLGQSFSRRAMARTVSRRLCHD